MSDAPAAPVITNGVPPDTQAIDDTPGFKVATRSVLLAELLRNSASLPSGLRWQPCVLHHG